MKKTEPYELLQGKRAALLKRPVASNADTHHFPMKRTGAPEKRRWFQFWSRKHVR